MIELANRHPRVNILRPGPGVGGHCIPVDPWFIMSGAPGHSQLIHQARKVNDYKPKWVVEQVLKAVERVSENIKEEDQKARRVFWFSFQSKQ